MGAAFAARLPLLLSLGMMVKVSSTEGLKVVLMQIFQGIGTKFEPTGWNAVSYRMRNQMINVSSARIKNA